MRYLQAGGRESEHYTEALDLINRERALEPPSASGTPRIEPAAPTGAAAPVPSEEPPG